MMGLSLTHFRDRHHAGKCLGEALVRYQLAPDAVILALPRGGVPIASEVANMLGLPFDVLLVRKLGVPGFEEVAMGAISTGDVKVINDDVIARFDVSDTALEEVLAFEQLELDRRDKLYRRGLPPIEVTAKQVIVVDDGVATGATMMAAVKALREMEVAEVIVACPVGAPATVTKLMALADDVICLHMPEPFHGVGQWYLEFPQTSDQEVLDALARVKQSFSAECG